MVALLKIKAVIKIAKGKQQLIKILYLSLIIIHFNPTIMTKLFLSLALFITLACNNSKAPSADAGPGTDSAVAKSYEWTDEEEKEFLAGCVDNARTSVSDTAAYAHCKCVLDQLKLTFPNMDSASAIIMDTTKAALFVAKCK